MRITMTKSTAIARLLLVLATVTVTSVMAEQLDERPVDADTRARVIEGVLKQVEAHYVIPDMAKTMAETIRSNEHAGQYATVTSSYHLATTLTQDLQSVSHDKHLLVLYGKLAPTPADKEERQEFWRQTNFGFAKAEVRDGNVGYLEVHYFGPLNDEVKHAMAAAMEIIASSDALIIDMRQNAGGSPATVAALASYFFDKRTLINRIYWHDPERIEEFWTTVDMDGPKYGGVKPIFVLSSTYTRSGGEEFCYDLQTQKRAIIVGEGTWGGAHPTHGYQVTETFAVVVPVGRAVNPVTGTNWEGVGISPDVRVQSDSALGEALRLARQSIASKK
jgi:hypothetical protein